jgi:hypothetical protein
MAAVVVVSLGVGGTMFYTDNSEALADYDEAHSETTEIYDSAQEILQDADALEPELQGTLEEQLIEVEDLLQADAPGVMSFGIADRVDELVGHRQKIEASSSDLTAAIDRRDSYNSAISDGEGALTEAEDLLDETEGEVLDDDAYEQLQTYVSDLEEALDTEPDETSMQSYSDATSAITDAAEEISDASTVVSASHEDWVEAEEEKAQQDPANYETISERDWQLVQRDPDAYKGEKYVVYGAVTQADAMTGEATIRVNTGPVQQSRQYDYDVNTMVLAGTSGVFSEVVKDDHVKMLIEIGGSMTYDTTIGGSASAVMALAYDVEVLGQF